MNYVKIHYLYSTKRRFSDEWEVEIRQAVCQGRHNEGTVTRQPLDGHLGSGKSIVKPTENGRFLFLRGGDAYAKYAATCQPLATGKVAFH